MKVFVTGATGYIGGAVAAGLRDAGHQVVGLARSEEKAAQLEARGIAPVLGSLEEAAAEWGEGAARHTMASNSRVRAKRARAELGWAPHRRSLIEEIAAVTR